MPGVSGVPAREFSHHRHPDFNIIPQLRARNKQIAKKAPPKPKHLTGHPFPAVCRVQISAQGGLVLIPFAHSAVFQMGLAALHGVLVDGDTDDGGVIGHIIHDRQQDAFHDAAQTAGTGLALNGLAGDRVEGLVGELQLYTVHAQQFLVLLDQAVAGLLEHTHQCVLVQ